MAPRRKASTSKGKPVAAADGPAAAFTGGIAVVPATDQPAGRKSLARHKADGSLAVQAVPSRKFFGAELPLPAARVDKDGKLVRDRRVQPLLANAYLVGERGTEQSVLLGGGAVRLDDLREGVPGRGEWGGTAPLPEAAATAPASS